MLRVGYLCSNAKLAHDDGKYEIIGDPTEGSLIVLWEKGKFAGGYDNFSLIGEIPFDSERKRMSKIFENKTSKKAQAYVKGAPDILLGLCDRIYENGSVRKLTKKDKEKINSINFSFAEQSLRVLALAYKDVPKSAKYDVNEVEKNLIFAGLAGMFDAPREGIKEAISQCNDARIKVMIITGDHAITTKAVAKQIGLFNEGDLILSGDEIENISDEKLESIIDNVSIVARALPIQKLRIVNALQKNGHIVAMTGDGVNDAPALKKADIGIAMGITGTSVAKEVSDAILVDDNFATIVNAVKEGRDIYDKMIKSARYLLSCNSGEIMSVFLAIMLNFPLPLLPLQLLLMNILTDDFPALGLGSDPGDENIMKRHPRQPKEKPISAKMFILIFMFGLIMSIGTLFVFMQYKDIDLKKARTAAFTTLVVFQLFAVISSRSIYPSLKHLNPLSNRMLLGALLLSLLIQILVVYWEPLQYIFGTSSLLPGELAMIFIISSMGFVVMESSKFLIKWMDRS